MNAMQRRMLKRLEALKDDSTMCPGQLSRDCGSTLRVARADILALADAGKIVLSQRGKTIKTETLKGPFRVRLN